MHNRSKRKTYTAYLCCLR